MPAVPGPRQALRNLPTSDRGSPLVRRLSADAPRPRGRPPGHRRPRRYRRVRGGDSNRSSGPFDILFVEGSVSTPEQAEEIVRLRAATTMLVTIGACATAGGIQALRNWADHDAIRSLVYPQRIRRVARDVDADRGPRRR